VCELSLPRRRRQPAEESARPRLLAQDTAFQIGGPNYTLEPHDFPFTKHTDENEPSLILSDTNDVVSSQGVFNAKFLDVTPPSPTDACDGVADTVFHVGGINTRRVEPRNAPTVFNAVFNFRNFWDGRANQNFNGVNPFGQRDENAHVWKTNASGGVEQVSIVIPLGSLASQAVGPPRSDFEMSCAGRIFATIGGKLLAASVVPLGLQFVDPSDSVLEPYARGSGTPGSLTVSYAELVRGAAGTSTKSVTHVSVVPSLSTLCWSPTHPFGTNSWGWSKGTRSTKSRSWLLRTSSGIARFASLIATWHESLPPSQ
jgi:hypothetical protein